MDKMKSNSKIIIVVSLVFIILLFGISLSLLNYKMATSETSVDESTNRYSWGTLEEDKNIYLYIGDKNALHNYLETSILKNLENLGYSVEITSEFKDNYNKKAILISFIEKEINYNPFFPNSNIVLLFYYTSTGDTRYFNEFKEGKIPPVIHEIEEDHEYKGELLVVSNINLDNRTRGLISIKAYSEYLANSLGSSVERIME